MKKVFLGLAVVALLFSFVACNSEPGSGGSTSVDGTWKAYYEDIEQQTPGEVKYAYFTVTVNGNNVSLEIACKDVNGDPVMGTYIGTQEIDRQHYTIPNQRPKDKHCGKI